jgi:hypothetical protein
MRAADSISGDMWQTGLASNGGVDSFIPVRNVLCTLDFINIALRQRFTVKLFFFCFVEVIIIVIVLCTV